MKTPDETKRRFAEAIEEPFFLAGCVDHDLIEARGKAPASMADALAYIRQLEAERDAAVADMKQAAIYLCCACDNYHPAVRGVSHHYCEKLGKRDDFTGAISCGMFKWRGLPDPPKEDEHG